MTKITILDGGLSRELTKFGAELKQPEWSAGALLDNPDTVTQAHTAFFEAGCEIATTNSYALVPFHLGQECFENKGFELAELSGKLARKAALQSQTPSSPLQVAGSLPPACGSYVPEKFDALAAKEILATLVDALEPHCDLWLAETMSSLEEARVTTQAAQASSKPFWLSYSLHDDDPSQSPKLRSGESLKDAIELAVDLKVDAILFNCSMPEVMEQAVLETKEQLSLLGYDIPIGVYANGFVARGNDGAANEVVSAIRDDLTPRKHLEYVERWINAGATIIGGCCGVGSEHMQVISQFVEHER